MMNRLKKAVCMLFAAVMLLSLAAGASADEYYFGTKDVKLWDDSDYTLTVDKHWEIIDHTLYKGERQILHYGRYFYPMEGMDDLMAQAYLISFSQNVLHFEPTEVTTLRIPGVTACALNALYYNKRATNRQRVVLMSTGKEIIYFFSGLSEQELSDIVSTFKVNP